MFLFFCSHLDTSLLISKSLFTLGVFCSKLDFLSHIGIFLFTREYFSLFWYVSANCWSISSSIWIRYIYILGFFCSHRYFIFLFSVQTWTFLLLGNLNSHWGPKFRHFSSYWDFSVQTWILQFMLVYFSQMLKHLF